MHRTYETASPWRKALGKLHQHHARIAGKTLRHLPDNQPMVSICFDDFPDSAATQGATLLEQAGHRGTYYTCFGQQTNVQQIQALHDAGHEIGCHTYHHVNASFNSTQHFQQSCRDNMQTAKKLGIELKQFCYPQGGMTLRSKQYIWQHYESARSGFWGINRHATDIFCLASIPFYESTQHKVNDYIAQIENNSGWLILFTHDVSDTPSPHGISRQALSSLLTSLHNKNIPIKPVGSIIRLLN